MSQEHTFDLLVIGGGINGAGIARDAEDALWRRSKLGLHLDKAAQERVAVWFSNAVVPA